MSTSLDAAACAVFLLVAVSLAGLCQSLWLASPAARAFAAPIDGGRRFRGRRVFGENKTWRGVVVMAPATGAAFAIVAAAIPGGAAAAGLWPLTSTQYAALGTWAGLGFMAAHYPDAPLWTAGFSFGAFVSLTAGARDDRVSRLIGIAPALHMYDFSFLKTCTKPKYFVQGERDELCPLPQMQAFFGELLPPKELAVVGGANHLFNGQVEEVGAALTRLLGTERLG